MKINFSVIIITYFSENYIEPCIFLPDWRVTLIYQAKLAQSHKNIAEKEKGRAENALSSLA